MGLWSDMGGTWSFLSAKFLHFCTSFALTRALCQYTISEKFLDDVFIRQRRNPEDSKHPICKMFYSP